MKTGQLLTYSIYVSCHEGM